MFTNHAYNLLAQLTEEHRSIWRIKKHYLKESKGCKECQALWKKLDKEKERTIKEIARLVRSHK